MNRINVKLYHGQGTLCVNARGPQAEPKSEQAVLKLLDSIGPGDWVAVCGNMMRGLSGDFLIRLSDCVHAHSAKLVIDMETLTPALIQRCRPVLIKPNFYEFKRLIHRLELTLSELTEAADRLLESGAENILISLGADGAYLAGSDGGYRLHQQPVEAVNQVGSGDAMLAAFVGKLSEGCSKAEALAWAGAAGSSVAMTQEEVRLEQIERGLSRVHVEKLESGR